MSTDAQALRANDDDWTNRFFRDADAFDVDVLVEWFADDIEVRFGNAPAIHGRAAARAAFTEFFGSIAGMRHVCETSVREGEAASQQSVVTYKAHDGREVSLPVASYLRRSAGGRLDRLWIYIDMAPLFAQAA